MAQETPDTEYLCDYAYLDKARISFYFAQLFEDGVLTATKRTAKDSSNDAIKFGASLKIASFEKGSGGQIEQGLERSFDPTWLAPLEVMNRLHEYSYIHANLQDTPLGGVFLISASLQILDIRLMRELYPEFSVNQLSEISSLPGLNPKQKQQLIAEKKKELELVTKIVQKLPHGIQAGFGTEQGSMWSTLPAENMLINPDDLALKHGSQIPGDWKILGIMDSKPHFAEATLPQYSGSLMENGLMELMGHFREFIGRPADAFGITPIAIFRTIKPVVSDEA